MRIPIIVFFKNSEYRQTSKCFRWMFIYFCATKQNSTEMSISERHSRHRKVKLSTLYEWHEWLICGNFVSYDDFRCWFFWLRTYTSFFNCHLLATRQLTSAVWSCIFSLVWRHKCKSTQDPLFRQQHPAGKKTIDVENVLTFLFCFIH